MLVLKTIKFVVLTLTIILIMNVTFLESLANNLNEDKTYITILHTNDTHGFLLPYETEKASHVGGAQYRATLINEIRTSNLESIPKRYTLLLDAGDLLEANAMSIFFKGEPDIEYMNLVKYDAMTFGNHEFGFGMEHFMNLIKKAQFPILSANILDKNTNDYLFSPYIIKEFNNLKIAIFGLTSHTLFYNTLPEDLEKIIFINKDEAFAKILPTLKEKSDFIILLSHLGIEEDREFAKMHPEVNMIIGSHSHTYLYKPEKIGETYIFQAGKYGECLGRIDLTFKNKKLESINSRLIHVADTTSNELIKKYKDPLDAKLSEKIGELSKSLENLNKYETKTPLFEFILKILCEETNSDCAMATSASLSGKLDTGPVFLKNIYRIMPYNNSCVIFKLTGSEIKQLMEYSISKKKTPYFIQTYNIDFEVIDNKVINLKINNQLVDENKIYNVASDNYMSAGGAEDNILKNLPNDRKISTKKLTRDIVIDYIKKHKNL